MRRVAGGEATAYETNDGRYRVERQDGWTDCEHPLCDQLHQRFIEGNQHLVSYISWHIWDTVRDDYAGGHQEFDTKRDAVAWLERHLLAPSR